MKVLLVGAYPPPYGGVQVHIAQLEKYLEGQGNSCFIINMGKNKTLQSLKLISPANAFHVAYHLFKRRDYVCHLHFGGTLHIRLLLLALYANLLFYKRCAITIHSGGLPVWGSPKNPFKRYLTLISFILCRTFICVNQEIADYFKQLGIKEERIHIISPFAFEDNQATNLLSIHFDSFIKNKKPLLCNIGLLEPEYDLELLLRVFKRFIQQYPKAGLVIVGSGSLYDRLKNVIFEFGLDNTVLLTGDIDHTITMQILALSDCYIRASRYDGDCISLKEAISLGIPAIATDTGMRPKEAILFPIGDEEALLKYLNNIISAPSKERRKNVATDSSTLANIEEILSKLN